MIFVLLGVVTDGTYALTAGTAAHWLRGHPTFLAREPWVSGGMYIGLGVVVASLVIFLFAMLAYSSTDMGESHGDSHLKHR